MPHDNAEFYARLPVFADFAAVMDPAKYRPLPDDWLIGVTDVEQSTQAIDDGRYKAVNTAGASVISAVTNALSGRAFPFVFGGDGASLAVSARDEASRARGARGDGGVVARRARPDAPRGARSRFRRPGAGARRRGRAVRAVGERLLRDVLRRRAHLGRARDEGRAVCGPAVGARGPSRPFGPVVPLERHSGVARRDPVAAAGAGTPGRSRVPRSGRNAAGRSRPQRGRGATGAGRRARRRLAAAGTGSRGARVARAGRESFPCPPARRRGDAAGLCRHAPRPARGRIRSRGLPAGCRRQFGFPQVRRQPAHDARLHAGPRRRDRAASGAGMARQRRAVRPAPAVGRPDDLHRAVDRRTQSFPLRRRRRGRLCAGGPADEGAGPKPPRRSSTGSCRPSRRPGYQRRLAPVATWPAPCSRRRACPTPPCSSCRWSWSSSCASGPRRRWCRTSARRR